MIENIRYSNLDNSQVIVEPQGWNVPQPCETWHQGVIDKWLAEGNTIAPYDENYGKTTEQIYLEKVTAAEALTDAHIQAPIASYNNANGTNFGGIHNCASYINTPSYTHYQFCVDVWAFNVQVWEAARQIQIDIINGNLVQPETEEAFIALLPVWGE